MATYTMNFKTSSTDKDLLLLHIEYSLAEQEGGRGGFAKLRDQMAAGAGDAEHELEPQAAVDFNMIDKCIDLFNRYNKNIVEKYDFKIISDTRCEVIVLFKHVFKKMGISRKYAHYEIALDRPNKKILFHAKKEPHPSFKTKHAEFLPIKHLVLFYNIAEGDDVPKVLLDICYKKVVPVDGEDPANLFQDLVVEMIEATFRNLQQHIHIDQHGEIAIVCDP